jgi:hypothetical protein
MTADSAEKSVRKKARIIKASTLLQAKVGLGPLDEKTLRRCQDVMDNNKVDFAPLAREDLNRLYTVIRQAQDGDMNRNEAARAITGPVMRLKAHASLFRYPLIGALANIMLGFLESLTEMDKDALEIVDAHHQTLKSIVINRMEGEGGSFGTMLKEELTEACKRYHAKKKENQG